MNIYLLLFLLRGGIAAVILGLLAVIQLLDLLRVKKLTSKKIIRTAITILLALFTAYATYELMPPEMQIQLFSSLL